MLPQVVAQRHLVAEVSTANLAREIGDVVFGFVVVGTDVVCSQFLVTFLALKRIFTSLNPSMT